MDKTLKQKWVNALRSGKYKQGRILFRNINNEYCCLGVLCDVSGSIWTHHWSDDYYIPDSNYGLMGTFISYKRDDLGLLEEHECVCIKMNDDENKSFIEIAQYIEENIPEN